MPFTPLTSEERDELNKLRAERGALISKGFAKATSSTPQISPDDANDMAKRASAAALGQMAGNQPSPDLAALKAKADAAAANNPDVMAMKAKEEEDAARLRNPNGSMSGSYN